MRDKFLKRFTVDDIKIKYKLILLYILSVLIPIVTTNYIFYKNISKSVREQQDIFLKETLQGVKVNITNSIDGCISITDILYKDNRLNIVLSNTYKNKNDFSNIYNSLLKDYISKYELLYKQIYEVNIYVTNPSIISGNGYYYANDAIKDTTWYKNANLSNNNIIIDNYFDKNNLSLSFRNSGRYFSIIRKLDNLAYGSVVKKILKIDIDYNFINRILKDESRSSDIFIVNNDNKIIFSNNIEYSSFTDGFIDFDTYKQKDNTFMLSEEMRGIFAGYKAIIIAPKIVVMNEVKSSNIDLLILTLINLGFPTIIILVISRSFNYRLKILSKHMKNIKDEKFDLVNCREGKDEIGELVGDFNRMSVQMDNLIKDVYMASIQKKNLEIARKQAELNALQSQINPHFLFNTLETIRMRSLLKGEKETSQIIKNLSKMLRRSLIWGNDLVTISEEIDFTENFLKIQMYRFEDKLKYNIYMSDEVKFYKIPKLSIMTLVENACIHGIENIAGIGTVEINIKGLKDRIKIIIKDDGIGISEEKMNNLIKFLKTQTDDLNDVSKSIGMKNVYTRLEMFYGCKFSFFIRSKENEGTEIEIQIPYDTSSNIK